MPFYFSTDELVLCDWECISLLMCTLFLCTGRVVYVDIINS